MTGTPVRALGDSSEDPLPEPSATNVEGVRPFLSFGGLGPAVEAETQKVARAGTGLLLRTDVDEDPGQMKRAQADEAPPLNVFTCVNQEMDGTYVLRQFRRKSKSRGKKCAATDGRAMHPCGVSG